jgi:hypothetical protein
MRPLTSRSLTLLVPALVAAALLGACGNGTSSGVNAAGGAGIATGTATAPVPDASGTGGTVATGGTGNGATGGTGSGSLAKVDACKLLTSQDASAILGNPVGDGKTGSSLGIPYPSCTYTATANSFQTVGLTVFDAAATANLINEYKTQFQGLTALTGVGDAALSEADGRLVVATKGGVGCVMLRAGDVTTSASASTQLMSGICQKVFASV